MAWLATNRFRPSLPGLLFAPVPAIGEGAPGNTALHHPAGAGSANGTTVETGEMSPAAPDTPASGSEKDLTAFFAIGLVINLAVLTAFFVWAVKEWKGG